MPKSKGSRLVVLASAVVLLLAFPAAAQATLAYVEIRPPEGRANSVHAGLPAVVIAADDGSASRRVGHGSSPHVSPDGRAVAFLHEGPGHAQELQIATTSGGPPKTLMGGLREAFYLEFSPNSEQILAERGPEIGKRKLVLITVASGAQKVLASGYFYGFGFDPEGKQVVYTKANSEKYPPKTDVFRVSAAGGPAVALTKDHASEYPLWGPTGKIVFVKLLDASKRKYGPKNELYLMNEKAGQVKRLTHTAVDPLLQGLFPTAWSGNGKRILAQFGGQDTSYAVGVNAQTGAQKPVIEATEEGLVGSAISFNGQTVFGYEGGFDPGNPHNVVSVTGGKTKVLVRNATEPSFGG
jgi:Tol biopolymer transport system component